MKRDKCPVYSLADYRERMGLEPKGSPFDDKERVLALKKKSEKKKQEEERRKKNVAILKQLKLIK